MKKTLILVLALLLVVSLVACASPMEKALVGTWKAVDTETDSEYGLGIEFTEDGTLRYGLTEEFFGALAEDADADADDLMAGLDALMTIEYEVKSDTEMIITASALFGLASESDTVTYSLQGDTLVFDGVTYQRAK